ncbi:MAG: hypothetical protein JWP91_779 [Fibrobacteres bacterium]|nr:hypothetical protein [Fibrobacterota bacterium]
MGEETEFYGEPKPWLDKFPAEEAIPASVLWDLLPYNREIGPALRGDPMPSGKLEKALWEAKREKDFQELLKLRDQGTHVESERMPKILQEDSKSNNVSVSFGVRLKEVRAKHSLSREELVRKMRLEFGSKAPSIGALKKIEAGSEPLEKNRRMYEWVFALPIANRSNRIQQGSPK